MPPSRGKQLPRDLTPPKSTPSHAQSSKKHAEPKDKDKDEGRVIEKGKTVPTSSGERGLDTAAARDVVPGSEITTRLERLRK